MKIKKQSQKQDVIEFDDLDFELELEEEYARFREPSQKALRRRHTKRKLDRLKEKKWFRDNGWFDDDYLYDFDEVNV